MEHTLWLQLVVVQAFIALQLNNAYAVTVRQAWVSAGWHPHPPTEA